MDPNNPTYGEKELVSLREHDTMVEHYEKELDKLHTEISALKKEIVKLKMQASIVAQLNNRSGGW